MTTDASVLNDYATRTFIVNAKGFRGARDRLPLKGDAHPQDESLVCAKRSVYAWWGHLNLMVAAFYRPRP